MAGDRWMGIKGDRGRELASNGREWLRGHGAKETGPCPGRDPLARPYQCCRGLVGEGNRRERSGRGVEKMNRRKADGWGSAGSDSRRSGGRVGLLGRLVGRTCVLGRREGGWKAGWAGWLARAEQADPARPSSSLFLFLFLISFPCLNSNLV